MPRCGSSPTIADSLLPIPPRCRRQRCPSPARDFGSSPRRAIITFEAARLALGTPAHTSLDFFEACRRKRNVIDYDHTSVATHTEAEEIVTEANNFFELLERWIAANHPKLAR